MQEEIDRELDEFLGEVRVVLPAVTVLFAFLLTIPFTARFELLSRVSRTAYFVAFITTATAIVLLLGETGYHRLRSKPYDKDRMLRTSSRQAIAALALLAVALSAVVFLVTSVLYGSGAAVAFTGFLGLLAVGTWFVLPLQRRWSAPRG
ncbi:MAG: DUF6328 family protein [Actinomycetota bacterium]|nr:DUF6328 family protein [Actinomycetota bacterium]